MELIKWSYIRKYTARLSSLNCLAHEMLLLTGLKQLLQTIDKANTERSPECLQHENYC